MRFLSAAGGLAALIGTAGMAQNGAGIDRAVYVERQSGGIRALEPATTLRSGDKVVLVLEWQRGAPARRFTIESPVPRTLAFQRAGSDAAEVSVDGGRRWGQLGKLHVGARLASAEDVTHLRLTVAGAPEGRLTYSAIVR
jgi:hypothetical protein